jgi:hypothetical protein
LFQLIFIGGNYSLGFKFYQDYSSFIMKKLLLFFLVVNSFGLSAQPGWRYVEKNINDYSPQDNKSSIDKYIYTIDSTSDLSKVDKSLSIFKISIEIKLKVLPKEIHPLLDSIREVVVICRNRQPTDISALSQLTNLTTISIDGNINSTSLERLKNLTSITIVNYAGTDLPDMHELTKLKILNVNYSKVKHINGISDCKSLTELHLYELDSLKALDFDMYGMNLETLSIRTCYHLKSIRGLSGSKSLKELTLSAIESLRTLDFDMGEMNVERLEISDCWLLNDISAMAKCKSLKTLSLVHLAALKEIDFDMGKMSLENLNIDGRNYYGCPLKNINGISSCRSLKSLEISGLDSLTLLDFHMNKMKLEELSISECNSLKSISGISECKSLKQLLIGDNPQLIKIPNLKDELFFVRHIFIHNNRSLIIPDNSIYEKSRNINWEILGNGINN